MTAKPDAYYSGNEYARHKSVKRLLSAVETIEPTQPTAITALHLAFPKAAALLLPLPVIPKVLKAATLLQLSDVASALLPTIAGAATVSGTAAAAGNRLSYTRNLLSGTTLTDPAATVTVTPATPEAATTGMFTIEAPNADTVRAVRMSLGLDAPRHGLHVARPLAHPESPKHFNRRNTVIMHVCSRPGLAC